MTRIAKPFVTGWNCIRQSGHCTGKRRTDAAYPATGISIRYFFAGHGLTTATPAALNGPTSRVATTKPCVAAIAAM